MPPHLSRYLHTGNNRMSEEDRQRLLLCTALIGVTRQKFGLPPDHAKSLEVELPELFSRVPGYEIKDAALFFNEATPWDRLHEDQDLARRLDNLMKSLYQYRSATPEWLRELVDDLYFYESGSGGICATPPPLRRLIAALAAQRPAKRVNDLCSGTGLLGLQVCKELGGQPSYRGGEQNAYLCALSRLLLFLSGVEDFSIRAGDAAGWRREENAPMGVYVADLPLVGSRTVPVEEDCQRLAGDRPSLYFDWALIWNVLAQMRSGERAFFVVTSGALVRKNEAELRRQLVKRNLIDAVITLPAGMYPSHGLPTALLVCEKGRARTEQVLFVDLEDCAVSGGRRTADLSQGTIEEVCRLFDRRAQEEAALPFREAVPREGSLNPALYLSQTAPAGRQVRLGDVAAVARGLQLTRYQLDGQGPCYLLNVRDIQDGEIHYEGAERIDHGTATWEERYRIREDDIILTSRGTALRIVIVPPGPPHAYISGNLTILRADPRRYHPYLLYAYLCSEEGLAALSLIQTGTTIRVLGVAALEGLLIPDGDPALMERRGRALKDLTLRHRAELQTLTETYQAQRRALLEGIYDREESDT